MIKVHGNMDGTGEKSTAALQEILACRVCLATTGKMFCIETCGLKQSFFDITGIQVLLGDGLPRHVCYICCGLLQKATEFRNKCHSTQSLLSSLPRTLDLMQQINSLHGRQLIKTNIVYVNVGEEIKIELNNDELDDLNNTDNALYDKALDKDYIEFITVKQEDEKLTIKNDLNDYEESNDNLSPVLDQTCDMKNKNEAPLNRKKRRKSDTKNKVKTVKAKNKKNTTAVAKIKKTDKAESESKHKQTCAAKMIKEFGSKYNFKVVTYSIEQQIKNMRDRMETVRYNRAKYKCEDCYAGFQFEHKYKKHRTKHDPALSGSHECEACKLRFRSKELLSYHVRVCHKYRYFCKECDKYFHSRFYALEHHQKHSGGGALFQCKYCPATFRKHCHYCDHTREKHGTASCAICHAVLTPGGLAQHMTLQHKETFKCQTCEKVFNDTAALEKHIKTSPNEVCNASDWVCTKCGECFSSKDCLDQHIVTSRKTQKRRRAVSVQGERKRYKLNSGDTATGGGSLVCELCGHVSASAMQLRQHLLVHSGDKPFKCATCSKGFRLKNQLKTHIRTHTGEKPHQCPECPAAFAAHTNLRRHKITVHQKVRAYSCDICHKSFHVKSGVQVHVRTVHMRIPMPPRVRNRKKKPADLGGERSVVDSGRDEKDGGRAIKRKIQRREGRTEDCKKARLEDDEEDRTAELLQDW